MFLHLHLCLCLFGWCEFRYIICVDEGHIWLFLLNPSDMLVQIPRTSHLLLVCLSRDVVVAALVVLTFPDAVTRR